MGELTACCLISKWFGTCGSIAVYITASAIPALATFLKYSGFILEADLALLGMSLTPWLLLYLIPMSSPSLPVSIGGDTLALVKYGRAVQLNFCHAKSCHYVLK